MTFQHTPKIFFLLPLRIAVLAWITASGCCDEKSVPRALDDLYSSEAKERNDAALQLARCGPKGGRAVPRLAELLYDQNVGVQSAAAYALRKIDTQEARDALERAIARRDQ